MSSGDTQEITADILNRTRTFYHSHKKERHQNDWDDFETELRTYLSKAIPLVVEEAHRHASERENDMLERRDFLSQNKQHLHRMCSQAQNELDRLQEEQRKLEHQMKHFEKNRSAKERELQSISQTIERKQTTLNSIQKQRNERKNSKEINALQKRCKDLQKLYEEMNEEAVQMKEAFQEQHQEEEENTEQKQDSYHAQETSSSDLSSDNDLSTTLVTENMSDFGGEYENNHECLICQEEEKYYVLSCCRKAVCYNCLDGWFRVALKDISQLPIRCPNCRDKGEDLSPARTPYPSSLSDAEISRIETATLRIEKGLIPCVFPDCDGYHEIPEDEDITNAECPTCHRMLCVKCKVKWSLHAGMTCAEFQQSRRGETLDAETRKNLGIKQCPKCREGVQKNQGCNHLHCNNCGSDFCWLCLETFTKLEEHFSANHILFDPNDVIY